MSRKSVEVKLSGHLLHHYPVCETRQFGLFILEIRVIAERNIQKSKSTNHGEIVAKGGCLAQKVVAFFFFEQEDRFASPKEVRLHAFLFAQKNFR